MPAENLNPTPHQDVNALLQELLDEVRAILGSHFIGMYLDGSLASGDFDQDSDIDFVVVTDEPVTMEQFEALQRMHDRLALLDSIWAIQLEGYYISKQAIRRCDPLLGNYPNLERGPGERLKWVQHEPAWDIHRSILRERGITLVGPDPQSLIDSITPDDLRQTMRIILKNWADHFLYHPEYMKQRGYQSYIVLSLCRMLYTFQHGTVVSKPVALRWVQQNLDPYWAPLLQSAWIGRHHSDSESTSEDLSGTQELFRYALEQIR